MSTGQGNGKNIDISSKYQVELNSKYSTFNKQGASSGQNSTAQEVNALKEQLKKKKESE